LVQKKNSGESDSSISEDSSSKKDDNILKPENSSENLNSNVVEKTVKSNIEENISEKGASHPKHFVQQQQRCTFHRK
jgi:hypothetical protein